VEESVTSLFIPTTPQHVNREDAASLLELSCHEVGDQGEDAASSSPNSRRYETA
jgi:hypothetical protein